MGLRDRLRSFATPPTAPADPAPQTVARGNSGRWHTNGFLQYEETNRELVHPYGHRVFDRMWRTDPDVRHAMWMFFNPILGGTWSVEPYGGDEATDKDRQAADLVRWALFENLRGGLKGHLAQALPVVSRSGLAPFEQEWDTASYQGKTVLAPRRLGLRLPRSIWRFNETDDELLESLEQNTIRKGNVLLPATELVYYRAGAEGNNWEGTSLLRPVYKSWFLKDGIERIDAIAQELEATGLPIVYPPSAEGVDATTLDDLEEQLAAIRAGETAFLMMPGPHAQDLKDNPERGWRVDVEGRGGSQGGRDPQASLKYHGDKIASGLISEFMRLGHQGVGARATADVQQDPFHSAVEGFASTVIEATLNDSPDTVAVPLVRRIVNVNMGELDGYPTVRLQLVDSTSLEELATFVTTLVTSKALTPDHPLEDFLRERAELPAADPAERARRDKLQVKADEMALNPPEPAPNGDGGDAPPADAKPKTAARQQRDLRHWEQLMSLDAIEQGIDGARARLEHSCGTPVRTAAAAIAQQINAGKEPKITPTGDLVDALTSELTDLYSLGRQTVRDELNRQRPQPAWAQPYARPKVIDVMARRARVAATAIVAAITRRLHALHLDGQVGLGELQAEGERAGLAALRSEAQLNAAPALNQGRGDEIDAHKDEIAGVRYTSILDGNRCTDCARADDDVLRKLDDPVRLHRRPPNPECLGGGRCRCMEFAQLRDEQPT